MVKWYLKAGEAMIPNMEEEEVRRSQRFLHFAISTLCAFQNTTNSNLRSKDPTLLELGSYFMSFAKQANLIPPKIAVIFYNSVKLLLVVRSTHVSQVLYLPFILFLLFCQKMNVDVLIHSFQFGWSLSHDYQV